MLVPQKSESHLKTHKNKFSHITEVDEQKTSSLVRPRRWNNFIVKFENLKQISIIRASQKKINVKNNLRRIKSNFFSRKIWNKSHQNFSTMLLGSWEIWLCQFCTQSIFGNNGTSIYCARVELKAFPPSDHGWDLCQKIFFKSLE